MDNSPVILRVSTRDRTAVARELLAHRRAGRLDTQEYEARVALATAARTEDDLRAPLLDLPDLPSPAAGVPAHPVAGAPFPRQASALGDAFDVMTLLITLAAFVCTGLLLATSGGWLRSDEQVAIGLAAFGSFTVGAGAVHLCHRVFGRSGQRG